MRNVNFFIPIANIRNLTQIDHEDLLVSIHGKKAILDERVQPREIR